MFLEKCHETSVKLAEKLGSDNGARVNASGARVEPAFSLELHHRDTVRPFLRSAHVIISFFPDNALSRRRQ